MRRGGVFSTICMGIALALGLAVSGSASETITYTYDALGRLVAAESTGSVNDGQGAATIYDAAGNRTNYTVDGATPTTANIEVANASITEGGVLSFEVTRSGITSSAVSVDYTITDVTTDSSDYSGATSGTVNFAAEDTAETITLQTVDDSILEGDETLEVTLSNPSSGAAITGGTATGTINDNEIGISIADASAEEGNAVSFAVTLNAPAPSTITVDYATSDGTASSSSDYTAGSGTLTFLANETSKTILVATTDDTDFEGDETFSVTLSSPSGPAGIVNGSATGTILDNDEPGLPVISVADASATEGSPVVFTITMSHAATQNVKVDISTSNGTASSGFFGIGGDYIPALFASVNFAAGETSKTYSVTTVQDSSLEGDETFNLTISLSGAHQSRATIGNGTAVGTIIDDELPPSPALSISNASTTEGGNLTFNVAMSPTASGTVTVDYATSGGTATSGSDFTAGSGTLSFAPGESTKSIIVATTDDGSTESAETMTVGLSNATGGAIIANATGTGTINDNDGPTLPVVSVSNASAIEGNNTNMVFTLTMTPAASQSITVNYATSDGTATGSGGRRDYNAKSGTVTFSNGSSTRTVSVGLRGDPYPEDDETFFLTISLTGANQNKATIGNAVGTGTIIDND